ncbi:MAG: DUF3365 domain-containing protein [Pseudomonadota bacterium]
MNTKMHTGRVGHACRRSLLMAILVAASTAPATAQAADLDALTKTARTAAKSLVSSLKTELKSALKEGGPVHAVSFCKITAPAIAAAQSVEFGMQVERTALRVRNPANAPDAFERETMEQFLAEVAAGKDLATLERAEIVTNDDGTKTFRFLKPIPMGAQPCLACHGSSIKPEVSKVISDAYPEDQAVGFKPGDLRGAFSISKPL